MDVVGSLRKMRLHAAPWLLVGVAVVAIGAFVYLTGTHDSLGSGSRPGSAPSGSGSRSGSQASGSTANRPSGPTYSLRSSVPTMGAANVASTAPISLTFTKPVALHKVSPVLTPHVAGDWVQSSPTTLSFDPAAPLVPGVQEQVTVPGGTSGLLGTTGEELARPTTVTFDIASGDMLRVQQLLAGLDYLPLGFIPAGPPPPLSDLAVDQEGSFAWRWADQPSELMSLWIQGQENEIVKAAIESFENQNGIGVDGIAGPAVWTSLINDTINHKVNATPYVYVLVNKVEPENLTLWDNGAAQYVGIPVNTGAPGADTTDGSYAVFEHVRYSDMKGTNPDGTTYNDPNVPYASYFNGGDALHGFIRASYGTPQSNGCVEMPYADASLVWPLTPIGTLVTVEGPNYGSAPPPTTTTTTSSTTTTTTAPAPAVTTTTTAPPALPATTPTAPTGGTGTGGTP
jgi:lipoprotein-anchoring transpeptidase ErfK/SrfK